MIQGKGVRTSKALKNYREIVRVVCNPLTFDFSLADGRGDLRDIDITENLLSTVAEGTGISVIKVSDPWEQSLVGAIDTSADALGGYYREFSLMSRGRNN